MATNRQQREAREARDRLKAYTARQEVHGIQQRRRVRDNIWAVVGVIAVVGLATFTQIVYFTAGPGVPTPAPSVSSTPQAGQNVGAPDPTLAEARTWTGALTLNDVALDIELDGAAAPQAVSGWVQDVTSDYYFGKTCHRLAESDGFGILQCGSIDGAGGPDPAFSYGPIENAPADDFYPAGTIAMARAGDNAYSNGHQFFIVFKDTTIPSDTAGGYTVVGKVTSGLQSLIDSITSKGITPVSSATDGSPVVATSITELTLQ